MKVPIVEYIRRSSRPAIGFEEACWLVWPSNLESGLSAAMSNARFIHVNAPVVAVQRDGRMEYFDSEGTLGWTSNLAWPRANLEMARLPARGAFPEEDSSLNENSSEEAGED